MDDRYSPASKTFRERRIGADWSLARMQAASDAELVSKYMTEGRPSDSVSGVSVLSHTTTRLFGDEVVVGYTVAGGAKPVRQQRILTLREQGGCWTADMPLEAWVRLDDAAKELKATRSDAPLVRMGPPAASLKVTLASQTERSGMVEGHQRGVEGPYGRVWLSTDSILTEEDVESARASYDCNVTMMEVEEPSLLLTFTDAGADKLKRWSSSNMGQLLAISVDGEPLVVAKVAGVLGKKMSMCLRRARLEEAEVMAQRLMGWQK